jgi:hypothetical protein
MFVVPVKYIQVSNEEQEEVEVDAVDLSPLQEDIEVGRHIPHPRILLLSVQVLASDIVASIGVVPIWLFVVSPLGVVKVLTT